MDESRLPLAAISDSELEQALIDLGRVLAYPVTPDLSRQVRVRLQGEISSSGRQPSPQPLSRLGGRGGLAFGEISHFAPQIGTMRMDPQSNASPDSAEPATDGPGWTRAIAGFPHDRDTKRSEI